MSTWNKHYHWKTKGCTPWARDWLTTTCVGTAATQDNLSVRVDGLASLEGDVELGNRKGKLITIYEAAVTFSWSGTHGEDKVEGQLVCDEFSHEVHDDKREYEFNVTQSTGPPAARDLVRAKVVPELQTRLRGFQTALIETHAKDLGHDEPPSATAAAAAAGDASSKQGSSTSAPNAAPASSSAPAPTASTKTAAPTSTKSTSTSSTTSTSASTSASDIKVSLDLPMSRADLWDLLTNSARIPMWTRSAGDGFRPAGSSSSSSSSSSSTAAATAAEPAEGSTFSLFGGNVSGTVLSLSPPATLVQSWRLSSWPTSVNAQLKTTLKEGHDSTLLELVLTGVPKGEEEATERGLRTFYLTSLQTVVGGVLA